MNLDAAQLKKLLTEEDEAEPHTLKIRISYTEIRDILIQSGFKNDQIWDVADGLHPVAYKAAKAIVLKTAAILLPAVDPKNIEVEFY